jgi:hypothetical protein
MGAVGRSCAVALCLGGAIVLAGLGHVHDRLAVAIESRRFRATQDCPKGSLREAVGRPEASSERSRSPR